MKKSTLRSALLATAAVFGLAAPAAQAQTPETVTVWFTKGFYAAEDQALERVIQRYTAATGVKVELSLHSTEDCVTKSVAAVEARTPPDMAFCTTYDFRTTGRWAFEGRLEDLTSIITPIQSTFQPAALATTLLARRDGTKAYYAMPIQQQFMHFNYWKDMVEQAGATEADIPKDWDGFWNFWCDRVQNGLRARGQRIFGIGHPMGIGASDTFYSFLTWANAYNVQVVDQAGNLVLDQPANRANMIKAVETYAGIFTRGCSPTSSINWLDPDNNVAFHNRQTVATHNATISIAGKWLDDSNNQNLTAEQRTQAGRNYTDLIRTIPWPRKPDGTSLPTRAAVKTAVVFADGRNKRRGMEFMAFLMKDENLAPFVEGSLGRWFPVTNSGVESPFWSADNHRRAVKEQYSQGTVPFEFVYNFRFTQVNAENVWARAVQRVAQDKVAGSVAVDEMIARIKQILAAGG
ncbi:MAG: ABC transporter substrate-binding protein [Alphaproteobacteria bacterium]|jgi:multiple sugar transport system substrate-binding protein